VARYAYPGQRASPALHIQALPSDLGGLAFIVARADARLLAWADGRQGGTLLFVCGCDGAAHTGAVTLGTFPGGSFAPLSQRAALGWCSRDVSCRSATDESVSFLAFGMSQRQRVVMQARLRAHSLGWLVGAPTVTWPQLAPKGSCSYLVSGVHAVSRDVLKGCANWRCSVMTAGVRRALELHGVGQRRAGVVMRRWHVCIAEHLHAEWRRMRRLRNLITIRCGGEMVEKRNRRREAERRILAGGAALEELLSATSRAAKKRKVAGARARSTQSMRSRILDWTRMGEPLVAEAGSHLRLKAASHRDRLAATPGEPGGGETGTGIPTSWDVARKAPTTRLMRCPSGHVLDGRLAPTASGVTCDECDAHVEQHGRVQSCLQCDHDVCVSCTTGFASTLTEQEHGGATGCRRRAGTARDDGADERVVRLEGAPLVVAETGVVTGGSSLMHGLLGSAVPPHRLLMLTLEGYCELSDTGLLSVVSRCKKLHTLRLVR
jgi:hypothetical protein